MSDLNLYEILVAHVKSPRMIGYQVIFQSKNLNETLVNRVVIRASKHHQIKPNERIIRLFIEENYIVVSQISYAGKDYFGSEGAYMLHVILTPLSEVQSVSPLALIGYLKGPESKPPPEVDIEPPLLTEPLIVDNLLIKEKSIEIENASRNVNIRALLSLLLTLTISKKTISIVCPGLFDAKVLLDALYRRTLKDHMVIIPVQITLNEDTNIFLGSLDVGGTDGGIIRLRFEENTLSFVGGPTDVKSLFLEISYLISKANNEEIDAIRSGNFVLDAEQAIGVLSVFRIKEGIINKNNVMHALRLLSEAPPSFQNVLLKCLSYISENIDEFEDRIVDVLYPLGGKYQRLKGRIENLILRLILRDPAKTRKLIERAMRNKDFGFIEKILKEILRDPTITGKNVDTFIYLSPFNFAKKFIIKAVKIMAKRHNREFLERIMLDCYPPTLSDILIELDKAKLCSEMLGCVENDDVLLKAAEESGILGLRDCIEGIIGNLNNMDIRRRVKMIETLHGKSILEMFAEIAPSKTIRMLVEAGIQHDVVVNLAEKIVSSQKIPVLERIYATIDINTIFEKNLRRFKQEAKRINIEIIRSLLGTLNERRRCGPALKYLSASYPVLKKLGLDYKAKEILTLCVQHKGSEILDALWAYITLKKDPKDIEEIFGFSRAPIRTIRILLELAETHQEKGKRVIIRIHELLSLWLADELKRVYRVFKKDGDLGKLKSIAWYIKKHFVGLTYLLAMLSVIYDEDIPNEKLNEVINVIMKIGKEIIKMENIDYSLKKRFLLNIMSVPETIRRELGAVEEVAIILRPCTLEIIGRLESVASKLYDKFLRMVKHGR